MVQLERGDGFLAGGVSAGDASGDPPPNAGDMVEFYRDSRGRLEYPPDHVGRRSYVTIEGHKYSVPKIYCYFSGGRYYLFGTHSHSAHGPMIMRDLEPYISPLDGSLVTSRSTHRAHMRQHGVIEMGNEYPKGPRAPTEMPRAGGDIARALRGDL